MLNIIAAIGKNRELGKNGDLIWRISEDLKKLKELTTGHPIIMGRKTYESIGRPLPGRTNIVITRDTSYEAEGCIVVNSLEGALSEAKHSPGSDEIFIFGGASIYEAALPQTDRVYLTLIEATDSEADTYFPEYAGDFKEIARHGQREHNGLKYEWVDLERK